MIYLRVTINSTSWTTHHLRLDIILDNVIKEGAQETDSHYRLWEFGLFHIDHTTWTFKVRIRVEILIVSGV